MIEIDIATTDDKALAKGLVDAAQLAREQARMTVVKSGTETIAAIVPYGVALALEPGVVRLAGDTSWTELPAEGLFCPAGRKIGSVTWKRAVGRPEAVHADDGTMCTDTRTPTAAA